MTLPTLETETTTTTTRRVALTETQVEGILTEWARATYGMQNPQVEMDCGQGFLRDTVITDTETVTSEDARA